MNTLLNRINENIKSAMKAKNGLMLNTLRMVLAAATNMAIDKRVNLFDITELELMAIIRKEIVKRNDTLVAIKGTSRDAGTTELEIAILQAYLPAEMGLAELKTLVETVISELGATTKKDMGKVMKEVTARANGTADGKRISTVVGCLLK